MTNQNNRGRTFWDFISENPRTTFATIVILFSLLIFIIINKYTFKNNYFTLEPEKSENQKNIIVSDTISQNKTFKTPISKSLIIKKNKVPQEITKRNTQKKDSIIQPTIVSVSSNNQSGGITANQVNIGAIPRNLDENF